MGLAEAGAEGVARVAAGLGWSGGAYHGALPRTQHPLPGGDLVCHVAAMRARHLRSNRPAPLGSHCDVLTRAVLSRETPAHGGGLAGAGRAPVPRHPRTAHPRRPVRDRRPHVSPAQASPAPPVASSRAPQCSAPRGHASSSVRRRVKHWRVALRPAGCREVASAPRRHNGRGTSSVVMQLGSATERHWTTESIVMLSKDMHHALQLVVHAVIVHPAWQQESGGPCHAPGRWANRIAYPRHRSSA